MGWTSRQQIQSDKEEILSEINCDNEHGKWEVIDYSQKGNVAYMAVDFLNKETGQKKVFACVALIRHFNGEISTKLMDESMGPYSYDCPKRILNKLTEPSNECAANWRQSCTQKKTNSNVPNIGQKIKLNNPLKFSDGITRQVFEVIRRGKRGKSYKCQDTGTEVIIRGINQINFEVLS